MNSETSELFPLFKVCHLTTLISHLQEVEWGISFLQQMVFQVGIPNSFLLYKWGHDR